MPDTVIDSYKDQMERLSGSLPGWDSARAHAFDRLKNVGLPTTRSEDWRYSDIKSLRKTAFNPMRAPAATPDLPAALSE